MKLIALVLIGLTLQNGFQAEKDEVYYYGVALKIIRDSNDGKELRMNKGFAVSDEQLSFHTIGWSFKEELRTYLPMDETEFADQSNYYVKQNKELALLGSRRTSQLKVFFSQTKNGFFFAEAFKFPSKKTKYSDRPHFGTSKIFMFQIKGEEVNLISAKQLAYN
jgi:hypothetical protein